MPPMTDVKMPLEFIRDTKGGQQMNRYDRKPRYHLKSAITISLCLSLCACSGFKTWTERDKYLFGGYLTASTVDCIQSRNVEHEMNPVLADMKPEHMPYYFIATDILLYFLADSLPKYRTAILSGALSVEIVCVGNNFSAGIGMEF